jgi:hypothetical protein
VKTKRITVDVTSDVDVIRDQIESDHGVKMTYVQLINFLAHFYIKHANEPKTQWKPLVVASVKEKNT